jgi:hypothetical protein
MLELVVTIPAGAATILFTARVIDMTRRAIRPESTVSAIEGFRLGLGKHWATFRE